VSWRVRRKTVWRPIILWRARAACGVNRRPIRSWLQHFQKRDARDVKPHNLRSAPSYGGEDVDPRETRRILPVRAGLHGARFSSRTDLASELWIDRFSWIWMRQRMYAGPALIRNLVWCFKVYEVGPLRCLINPRHRSETRTGRLVTRRPHHENRQEDSEQGSISKFIDRP